MKAVKEWEEAAKEAKILKRKKAAERIATIERQINEDENDKTSCPPLLCMHHLSHGTTHNPPLMAESSDGPDGPNPISDSQQVDEFEPSCSDSNADNMQSVEEETPVKKKACTDKPSFRSKVKKIQKTSTQVVDHD